MGSWLAHRGRAKTPSEAPGHLADGVRALREGALCVALPSPVASVRDATWEALAAALRPGFRPVRITCATLPLSELSAWAARLLESEVPASGPVPLLELARHGPGPVVLYLEQGEALPVATARQLAGLLEQGEGHLRLMIAWGPPPRPRLERVLGALETRARVRRFGPDPAAAASHADQPPRSRAPTTPPRPEPPDPLRPTPDPERDVPRQALARALAGLEADLGAGASCTALAGAAGSGKTLALRHMERKLSGRFRVISLPYPALAPEEALTWLADLSGAPRGETATARLRAVAGPSGSGLVVLVDEASSLPAATRNLLLSLAEELPGLQLVLAWNDEGSKASRTLGSRVACHAVPARIEPAESAALLRARLGEEGSAWLSPERLARLHAAAEGRPACLLQLADREHRQVQPPDARGPRMESTSS